MSELFDCISDAGCDLPLSFKLVFEAVKKRSADPVYILRYGDASADRIILRIRSGVDAYLPMNEPQPSSCVSWGVEDFSQKLSTFTSMTDLILNTLSRHLSLDTRFRQQTKVNFQLAFLDADCRPLFVTARAGLTSATDFNNEMVSKQQAQLCGIEKQQQRIRYPNNLPAPTTSAWPSDSDGDLEDDAVSL